MAELSERAQERQFTARWLADEFDKLAKDFRRYRDHYVTTGGFGSAVECHYKAEAFEMAARNARSFGMVEQKERDS